MSFALLRPLHDPPRRALPPPVTGWYERDDL
jgi:hypothetical protein